MSVLIKHSTFNYMSQRPRGDPHAHRGERFSPLLWSGHFFFSLGKGIGAAGKNSPGKKLSFSNGFIDGKLFSKKKKNHQNS